jgi:hypothetical protein
MRDVPDRSPRTPWVKPQVRRISSGSAEFNTGISLPDGNGLS